MTGSTHHQAIVDRAGRVPHVSFWYWIFHPWRAWWINTLIREAFRWEATGEPDPDPAALSNAEKALLRRAQIAQASKTAATVARINDLAARYRLLERRVQHELVLAGIVRRRKIKPKIKVKMYAAEPIDRKQAKKIIEECREQIKADTRRGDTRHLERSSRTGEIIAFVTLLIDISALVTVVAGFFNVTPGNAGSKLPETITAIGFAFITALVLATLAHSAGTSAWQLRVTSGSVTDTRSTNDEPGRKKEFPPSRGLLYLKLSSLAVVSGTVAVSVATRIMQPTATVNTGPLGVVIGIMVGLAAFLSPWLIVVNRMRSGSLEVQTVEALSEAMAQIDDAAIRHEDAAAKAVEDAAKVRAIAERTQKTGRLSNEALWGACERVIELARSYHGKAGRYALRDDAPVDDDHVSTQALKEAGQKKIDSAMSGFDPPDDNVFELDDFRSEEGEAS